ncbi:hypothetical protein ACS0TY_020833 [Phlomoides rotata]
MWWMAAANASEKKKKKKQGFRFLCDFMVLGKKSGTVSMGKKCAASVFFVIIWILRGPDTSDFSYHGYVADQ